MTDTQLYLAIGVPIVVSLLFNGMLILFLRSDIQEIRSDLKTAMAKLFDIDNRVSRIEDKLGISSH